MNMTAIYAKISKHLQNGNPKIWSPSNIIKLFKIRFENDEFRWCLTLVRYVWTSSVTGFTNKRMPMVFDGGIFRSHFEKTAKSIFHRIPIENWETPTQSNVVICQSESKLL